MSKLNDRIKMLEKLVVDLQSKIDDLSRNVEEKINQPYSKVGKIRDRSQNRPVDPSTGLGQIFGGNLPWNDSELKVPPMGVKPDNPTRGYNKHFHSRYAGGALDISILELVEYDFNPSLHNPHCQQFWASYPEIKTSENLNGDLVEHIGTLKDSLVYDPDNERWCVYAVYKESEE